MPSIYGPTVSRENAAEWLRLNPRESQNPDLVAVADYSGNGGVNADELSRACNAGTVMLDGIHHFKLVDDTPPAPMPQQIQVQGQARKGAGIPVGVTIIGSMAGGLAIMMAGQKSKSMALQMLGIGVMFGGILMSPKLAKE